MSNEIPSILEMYEDLSLAKLAYELDQDGIKTYSHVDAWKDKYTLDVNE